MDVKRISTLMRKIDGSGSSGEWAAVQELRTLGAQFPHLLLERYRAAKAWKVRRSCVYHALRYARESEDAVALGREALHDRSRPVRFRACELLAYSLREDVLVDLKGALAPMGNGPEAEDVRAAIDAIESRNHNHFVDRDHSGKMTWTIA